MGEKEQKFEKKRHEHAELLTKCQRCLDEFPADEKEWSEEQREKYAKYDGDLSALETEIQEIETAIERDRRFKIRMEMKRQTEERDLRDNPDVTGTTVDDSAKRVEAFMEALRYGPQNIPVEQRALLAGDKVSAGYLTTPKEMAAGIIEQVKDAHVIRQLATVITLDTAQSLGSITLEADTDDFEWTTEIKTPTEGSDMEFGEREFVPHGCEKLLKISRKLLRHAPNAESYVQSRVMYVMGNTQETAFMTGDGSKKPLGLFVASDDGIPTGRDYSTGNTTTQIKGDNLIGAQGNQKAGYMNRWLFHRDTLTMIRKLKDGNGQYLFRPGLDAGVPPTLLGEPYILSEFAPNTFTTGEYVYIYGDLSYYWIVDSLRMEVQVLTELYAPKYIGYYWLFETDGQPALGEAFTRGKLA